MLEIMTRHGFGQCWRDLISLIWSTTSSHIILNGEPGRPVQHRRGLRQGDPLYSMASQDDKYSFVEAYGKVTHCHQCYSSLPWTLSNEFLTWRRHRDCSTQSGPIPSNLEPASYLCPASYTRYGQSPEYLAILWGGNWAIHKHTEIRVISDTV